MNEQQLEQWREEFDEYWFSRLPDYPADNLNKRAASRSSPLYDQACIHYLAACKKRNEEYNQVLTFLGSKNLVDEIQSLTQQLEEKITGETSDGYHTFNELYDHRRVLTTALFNMKPDLCVKSKLHSDGTMFDNYFIVGIATFDGWATYHYHIKHWGDFKCAEIEKFHEWDGHTSSDVIIRIEKLFNLTNPIDKKLTQQLKEKDEELDNLNNLYVPNIESENEHLKQLISRAIPWVEGNKTTRRLWTPPEVFKDLNEWLEEARKSL